MYNYPLKSLILFIIGLLAAIVATITYKKYRHTPSRCFLYFLWFTIFIELFGSIAYLYAYNCENWLIQLLIGVIPENYLRHNDWIYNIYLIITFNIYLYYFLMLVKTEKLKKIICLFIFCFAIICIYSIFSFENFHSAYYILIEGSGPLFLLVAAIFYFIDIFKSDDVLVFNKTLPFWIAAGALIFYLTTAPMFIFPYQLRRSSEITDYILFSANILLYSFFIIGFLIIPKPKK